MVKNERGRELKIIEYCLSKKKNRISSVCRLCEKGEEKKIYMVNVGKIKPNRLTVCRLWKKKRELKKMFNL